MNWKTVAIAVLITTAILLGGVVVNGLREERAAYAQGGVYSTYLAVSASVLEEQANFAILETESHRVMFYRVDVAKLKIEPITGRNLLTEIKQVVP